MMSKQFVPINGTKQYCLDGHPDRDKIIEEFKNECGNIVRRFTEERNTPRQFRLRPSNMGHPVRKLWFMANTPQPETEEQSHRPLMFLFGSLTEDIRNPSNAVQLAAVQQDGYVIKHIMNPSEALQLAAVQQDGWAIQSIENPSEAVKLAAVQEDGYAIRHIKNPSEAVQLAAVQRHGCAIKYIENPSEAVQLAAVRRNWRAIYYIKNPSEAAKKAAQR